MVRLPTVEGAEEAKRADRAGVPRSEALVAEQAGAAAKLLSRSLVAKRILRATGPPAHLQPGERMRSTAALALGDAEP
eukprot:15466388-Alexandrium_andersonii.AAC.1